MKKRITEGYHLEVEVSMPNYIINSTLERQLGICKEVEKQIKKHVENIGNISICEESHFECEFCHSKWEGNTFEFPNCCTKAQFDYYQWIIQELMNNPNITSSEVMEVIKIIHDQDKEMIIPKNILLKLSGVKYE